MLHHCLIAPAGPVLAFIEGLGGMEMLLIFVIVLLLFGGDKLPEFARGLGKTMREFKKAASGVEEEFKRAMEEDERKRAATPPPNPALPAASGSTSGYPEDGSGDYSGEAGPSAPAAAPGTTAAPTDSTASAATPDPKTTAATATPPTAAAKPAPVPNEDYP